MKRLIHFLILMAAAIAVAACSAQPANTPTPVATLVTVSTPVSEQDAVASAEQLIDLMIKQDFTTAFGHFDSAMKAALPEMQLEKAWESLIAQAGAYQAKLGTQPPTHQDQYTIVVITLQFEKAPIDLRVVVNSNTGLISGLRFMPNQSEAAKKYRPPTYADPNAFEEREVTVGAGEWQLSGTLTLPKGQAPFPAVVLVHGSGPNDRDETIGPNKPFKDLAWGLASHGIAVLRYDKRTKVYADKLASAANLTVKEETTDDAIAAIDLLRQTDSVEPTRIFVLGHSLGGMLAPRIGQADPNIAGLIIMAGPTRPLEDLMVEQIQYIASLDGAISPEEQQQIDLLEQQVKAIKALKPTDQISATQMLLVGPPSYWLDLQGYKPAEVASKLSQPMLILQGERDYQVTMQDFQNWKDALSSHSNVQLKTYPDLNHLFITGTGKSTPAEYNVPGNMSVNVIDDIAAWIKQH